MQEDGLGDISYSLIKTMQAQENRLVDTGYAIVQSRRAQEERLDNIDPSISKS